MLCLIVACTKCNQLAQLIQLWTTFKNVNHSYSCSALLVFQSTGINYECGHWDSNIMVRMIPASELHHLHSFLLLPIIPPLSLSCVCLFVSQRQVGAVVAGFPGRTVIARQGFLKVRHGSSFLQVDHSVALAVSRGRHHRCRYATLFHWRWSLWHFGSASSVSRATGGSSFQVYLDVVELARRWRRQVATMLLTGSAANSATACPLSTEIKAENPTTPFGRLGMGRACVV